MKKISIIVAIAENAAIGVDQHLLCHLPDDLKRFKALTTGQTVVMGRKTFGSLPKGALPNRQNIVLTSDRSAHYENVQVCHSLLEAIATCDPERELFVIGGASVYKEALTVADRLFLTYIHHVFPDADTFFPELDMTVWKEVAREDHPADEKHAYPYSFVDYERIGE